MLQFCFFTKHPLEFFSFLNGRLFVETRSSGNLEGHAKMEQSLDVHLRASPQNAPPSFKFFVDFWAASATTCRFVFRVEVFGEAFRHDGD